MAWLTRRGHRAVAWSTASWPNSASSSVWPARSTFDYDLVWHERAEAEWRTADPKTLERPISERLHKKLDEIVRSRDEEVLITLDILLDGFIKKLATSSQDQLQEPQD